jgi:20S proteasome subunit alpha 1
MQSGADKYITVFSNEGKLFQVEYSFNAVKNSGYTSVGVRGKDSVVVITQKKIPDKSIVPSSITHLYKVNEKLGVLFTGYHPDTSNLIYLMRNEALKFLDDFGYDIPVNVLAQKISEQCQFYTQNYHMRPLCCISMLYAYDVEKGPQLIKIDPSGFYMGYKACATGEKEQQTVNYLERDVKKRNNNSELSYEECISLAIKAMQSVSFKYIKN